MGCLKNIMFRITIHAESCENMGFRNKLSKIKVHNNVPKPMKQL